MLHLAIYVNIALIGTADEATVIGAHIHAILAPNYLANLTFKQLFVEPNIDTNISVQKNYALYIGAGYVGSTVNTSYSLYVEKPVNAINNYGSVINGNLGINTDTPSYTLDVVGSSNCKPSARTACSKITKAKSVESSLAG